MDSATIRCQFLGVILVIPGGVKMMSSVFCPLRHHVHTELCISEFK